MMQQQMQMQAVQDTVSQALQDAQRAVGGPRAVQRPAPT